MAVPQSLNQALRTLHLIDIENLMGGPNQGAVALRLAMVRYVVAVPVRHADQVIIACNPKLAFEAGTAWKGALLKPRHGHDGADLALLENSETEFVARRFARVVIGSGDGIFTERVLALRAVGVAVEVVSRSGSLSWALRHVAGSVHLLPEPVLAA